MRYIASIWPVAMKKVSIMEIKEILKAHCKIIESREINLNYMGLRNFMLQVYRCDHWSGCYWNHFYGIKSKLDACYAKASMWVIELDSPSREAVLKAKDAVREYCCMEKSSIHTSDTAKEAEMMKDLLYNENNCWLMNHSCPDKYLRFTKRLNRLEKLCRAEGFKKDDLVIVSDAVFALYNIKPSSKLSYISKGNLPNRLAKYNDREYELALEVYKDEILKPLNQVSFCGFKFIIPELLYKIKKVVLSND